MNTLSDVMQKQSTIKTTENGAIAYSTTNNDMLDFFSLAGSMRNRESEDIIEKFDLAYEKSPELAIKALFYIGDIRGGLGERRTFRLCLRRLANTNPEVVKRNIHLIPEYNRWDSIFELFDTDVEDTALDFISYQFIEDVTNKNDGKPISLLAKWLPSENASSNKTKLLAKKIRKALGLSSKRYRQHLSSLRKYLDVVETHMSANDWTNIKYENVPSNAMMRYRNAFYKHDEEGMNTYIDSVKSGEKKINSSVLYPYNIVHSYMDDYMWCAKKSLDDVLEEQWKALPDYVTDSNILVMADVSGSMIGRPIETSVGLATYFAQRNKGAFHNQYMTFTNRPHCVSIQDNWTLKKCIDYVMSKGVGYNTNLDMAFKYLLDMCTTNNIPQEELPTALVVISDMEIDRFGREGYNWSFVNRWERKFNEAGYKLPKLIMWNVEARNDTFLSQNPNVLYVSGQSTSTFQYFTAALNGKTAYDFMLDILNSDRYSLIDTTV